MPETALKFKRIHPSARIPTYAHADDAGLDLRSIENVSVPARGRATIRTGLAMALPDEHVGLIHPRSGLASKHGITVLNAPGTIDAGYRGEIKVILLNTEDEDFIVVAGDRIAQLVIQKVEHPRIIQIEEFDDETSRGEGGFGSTGRS